MVVNEICPDLQSSYRQHHSTETALLKVMNDVLLKMNSQHVTLIVLLDLVGATAQIWSSVAGYGKLCVWF